MALPHDWVSQRLTSKRVVRVWCRFCRDVRQDEFCEKVQDLLWSLPRNVLTNPMVDEAVTAVLSGNLDHPLVAELRASIVADTLTAEAVTTTVHALNTMFDV